MSSTPSSALSSNSTRSTSTGVEPMTSVTPMQLRRREDKVTDGGYPEKVVANAPLTEDNFFMVPKVVE